MTGESTLRGKVLPIGGVKEKLLAAHRAGITHIIMPKENEKDLRDIPTAVLEQLTIHLVETMDEVLDLALEKPLNLGVLKESKTEEFTPKIEHKDLPNPNESITH